ncbi:MAG: 4Fe-4S ferredoxin [Desulfuromonadales bacterium]|nr:4Fe-4S ferredoxin [Desulfuromonadales bacterium]
MTPSEHLTFCTKLIISLVNEAPQNHLHGFDEQAWGSPLIGVAAGNDPLFTQYKQIIGSVHWTPAEAFALAYPEQPVTAEDLRVVSWILPQTESTLADQRRETQLPAPRWIYSRHYGELFNEWLRRKVRDEFIDMGLKATAPTLLSDWAYRQTPQAGLCSNWSERHAAYAAGLGTFGLSDGFISEAGKAIRIGSVIVAADIEVTPRTAATHTANCLFYARGTCGACSKRCPVAAISKAGHDKIACHNYIRQVTAPYAKQLSGQEVTPCGLCQVCIPCEHRNPLRSDSK